MASPGDALRLFRFAGIDVYVHWSWALVALFEVQTIQRYGSPLWNGIEYLSLFGIVLLHEFGHALACLQVGGRVRYIMLWPLGGVAFVDPPPRPGAVLWSIAAGPLVNVVLVPITVMVMIAAKRVAPGADLSAFCRYLFWVNLGLLIFNMLPIYPMDGGQVLQALLWLVIGRVNSLIVVSIIGLVGGAGFVVVAISYGNWWLLLIALFVGMRCFAGFHQAQLLTNMLNGPRHLEARCPSCGEAPFAAKLWVCEHCGARFDAFVYRAVCPGCRMAFPSTMCPTCYCRHPISAWLTSPAPEAVAIQETTPPDGAGSWYHGLDRPDKE